MRHTTVRRVAATAAALLAAGAVTLLPTGAEAHQGAERISADRVHRLRFPSAPASATKVLPGNAPGEVLIKVRTEGLNTDFFKLTTATQPFKDGARDKATFKFPFHKKTSGVATYTYKLTRSQTDRTHAGVGTGWTLVWQLYAVNKNKSGNHKDRYFGQDQVRVPGEPAVGEERLRVAEYNVRNDSTFAKRADLIGAQIKDYNPGIATLSELFFKASNGGASVAAFIDGLKDAGIAGRYKLTRETTMTPQERKPDERNLQARILYDTTRYENVSKCGPDASYNCLIPFDADGGETDWAAWARFKDLSTSQEFYVVSFHLPHGPFDALRTKEMQQITTYVNNHFDDGVPVVIGGDTNSSQLRPGERPHDVLMERGYYDSASTVVHVNPNFGTANDYEVPQKPSPFQPSPRIDVIAMRGLTGSDRFENVVIHADQKSDYPSDHNMIVTDLRLPALP
jgi:hypothetical protein